MRQPFNSKHSAVMGTDRRSTAAGTHDYAYRFMSAINLFTADQQQQIIQAIRQAELNTSGEIRVHIENECTAQNVLDRAVEVFSQLGMHQTIQKNGVLFYLAVGSRKFAVLGDKGIDQVVPTNFWEDTKEIMRDHFRREHFTEGLCRAIEQAGNQLKQYFPRQSDDTNELPDELSIQ